MTTASGPGPAQAPDAHAEGTSGQMVRADLNRLLTRFVDALTKERSKASRTIENYEAELRAGLSEHPAGTDLDPEAVSFIVGRPLKDGAIPAPSTMRYRLAVWRTFGRFLKSRAGWHDNPAASVDWARVPARTGGRTTIDGQALQRLIEAAQHPSAAQYPRFHAAFAARDAAIVALLGYGGLRLSELVNLDVDHVQGLSAIGVQLDDDYSTEPLLHGFVRKGGAVRDLPINHEAAHLLGEWLQLRRVLPLPDGQDALFVSRMWSRISRRRVQTLIEKLGREAELSLKVTPHLLRHSFCTRLLIEHKVPLPTVQRLMDHSQLATTARYAHPGKEEERSAVDLLSDGGAHKP